MKLILGLFIVVAGIVVISFSATALFGSGAQADINHTTGLLNPGILAAMMGGVALTLFGLWQTFRGYEKLLSRHRS